MIRMNIGRIQKYISVLFAVMLLCGCATGPVSQTPVQTEEVALGTVPPTEDTVAVAASEEPEVSDVAEETPVPGPTEEPTPEPTETPEPEPTDTPEPNPFLGSWGIEDLPFLLDVRSDGTYTINSNGIEKTGTYKYNGSELSLYVSDDQSIDFKYYFNTDRMMHGSYVLRRSEIEASPVTETVPVTYSNENDTIAVSVRGAVVDAVLKDGRIAQEFCFTKQGLTPPEKSRDWFNVTDSGEPSAHIRTFKYDGSYTLWVRDTEGTILEPIDVEVASGYNYPIRAKNVEPIRRGLKQILEDHHSTIGDLNRKISADVAAAGLYTREGVVTAGVSLISNMSQMGFSIVYQGRGSYQGKDDWGANPKWGAKLNEPTEDGNGTYWYVGMQCVASIVWAYKQAGMNLVSERGSEIGRLGEHKQSGDNRIEYDRARTGDIVRTGGHYLMVIDRLDQDSDGAADAYLTYEMWAPHLTMLVLTFRQVRGRTFYAMDAFFDGTGHNIKKALYWENTFRIPKDALPDYLKKAIEYESSVQEFKALMEQFGF